MCRESHIQGLVIAPSVMSSAGISIRALCVALQGLHYLKVSTQLRTVFRGKNSRFTRSYTYDKHFNSDGGCKNYKLCTAVLHAEHCVGTQAYYLIYHNLQGVKRLTLLDLLEYTEQFYLVSVLLSASNGSDCFLEKGVLVALT